MREKCQTLKEKTFPLNQEELRHNLEAKMVKTTAKERGLCSNDFPFSTGG